MASILQKIYNISSSRLDERMSHEPHCICFFNSQRSILASPTQQNMFCLIYFFFLYEHELVYIYRRNYGLSSVFARLSPSALCALNKAKALIIMFTSTHENPAVMISNYKYFPARLQPQMVYCVFREVQFCLQLNYDIVHN